MPPLSKSALVAFRVISNLVRRTGKGFVRTFETLARMFGVCERRAWQLIAELRAAGYIGWEIVRKTGERGIAFWPLLALPKPPRRRFAPPAAPAFSCPKSAPSDALSKREKCTLAPSAPFKTTPVGKETTTDSASGVVVSPAEVSEPESEAVTVAVGAGLDRNAARRAVGEKPLEAVRSAVKAAKAYAATHEVRSLPALLFTAIRAGWLAPAPPSSHSSDRGEQPQRIVVAPAQMRTEMAPRPVEADSSSVAWEALSEDQRAELLAVALADALETASEAEKALVRRRGMDSLPVVMRAKRLARERAEALGASDAR
jgi:hypothetical protein